VIDFVPADHVAYFVRDTVREQLDGRIAPACEDRVDFMAVTGLNRPDFRTMSDFRKRHLQALQGLFVQVLKLCQRAGLVKWRWKAPR
jgi:Transposase domain (DUF772)